MKRITAIEIAVGAIIGCGVIWLALTLRRDTVQIAMPGTVLALSALKLESSADGPHHYLLRKTAVRVLLDSGGEFDVWTEGCRVGSRAAVLVTYSHAVGKVIDAVRAKCEEGNL